MANPQWTEVTSATSLNVEPRSVPQYRYTEVWNSGPDTAWINLETEADINYVNGNIELPAKSSIMIKFDETIYAISEGTSNISVWNRTMADMPGEV